MIWTALAALVLVLFRVHAFDVPLERDEGNYAYIGSRLLDGDRLYTEVWDHQPPGVFVLFAAVIAVCGDAPVVFRIHAICWSVATLVLITGYSLAIGAHRATTISGVLLWAIVSTDPGTAGDGCNREIYMNTLILAAWVLAAWIESTTLEAKRVAIGFPLQLATFGAGLLLGIASVMKTVVAVHWLVLVLWLTVVLWKRFDVATRFRSVLKSVILFGAGPAMLWGGTALYFAGTSRWDVFVDSVFAFNVAYADQDRDVWWRFVEFFTTPRASNIFSSALPLWICGLLGVFGLGVKSLSCARSNLTVLLVGSSFLAICLPGQFWPHYYYLAICPAVLSTAWLVGTLTDWVSKRTGVRQGFARVLAAAPAVVVVGVVLVGQTAHYLLQPPLGITERRYSYSARDFWARAQGENVRRVTDPGDEIFVYGDDASIYYYARRKGSSRFTMLTALRERYPGYQARREIMLAEVRDRRPRLVLVVLGEPTFPEWVEFLHSRYDAVGFDYRDGPTFEAVFMVLADRERPIEAIDWNWDRSMVGP